MRNVYQILVRTSKRREHLGDLGVDGRVLFVWVLRQQDAAVFDWPGIGLRRAFANTVMDFRVP
jgi:hypothetical protein